MLSSYEKLRAQVLVMFGGFLTKRKISSEFSKKRKIVHNESLSEISKTKNLTKLAQDFKFAIHFHSSHLRPETLIFNLGALVEF